MWIVLSVLSVLVIALFVRLWVVAHNLSELRAFLASVPEIQRHLETKGR